MRWQFWHSIRFTPAAASASSMHCLTWQFQYLHVENYITSTSWNLEMSSIDAAYTTFGGADCMGSQAISKGTWSESEFETQQELCLLPWRYDLIIERGWFRKEDAIYVNVYCTWLTVMFKTAHMWEETASLILSVVDKVKEKDEWESA